MPRITVLAGQQYGQLTVVREVEGEGVGRRKKRRVLCVCLCGKESSPRLEALRSGNTTSCGCTKVAPRTNSVPPTLPSADAVWFRLAHDKWMLIDRDAEPLFQQCKNLSVNSAGYAVWRVREGATTKSYLAHRMVLGLGPFCTDSTFVDHVNGNTLDNRKFNLRTCSAEQNTQNRRGTSRYGFKGVSPNGRRWQAKIASQGAVRCLGTYDTPEQAAHAYDAAALQLFGRFAKTNFSC